MAMHFPVMIPCLVLSIIDLPAGIAYEDLSTLVFLHSMPAAVLLSTDPDFSAIAVAIRTAIHHFGLITGIFPNLLKQTTVQFNGTSLGL